MLGSTLQLQKINLKTMILMILLLLLFNNNTSYRVLNVASAIKTLFYNLPVLTMSITSIDIETQNNRHFTDFCKIQFFFLMKCMKIS